MRQGQQNRRGRGRGRKPQNPLARNYESNGPDVKIRGTAAHIADKYMSLARDAIASGDMVTAESYLQHAEHYNRIIMAAQAQMGPQHGGQHQGGESPNGAYRQPARWNADEEGDEEFAAEGASGGEQAQGSQDQRRHAGDREHHQGGGRDRDRGRHGGNGRERGDRDGNGSDQAEAHQPDETNPDPVS